MGKIVIPNDETPGGITYTHGHADAVLRSHRWRTADNSAAYLLPHLKSGMSLLDVGCGPGTLTVDLARRVLPGATVGVDLAAGVVREAETFADEAGVAVRFEAGDFSAISAPEGGFDVVHAHQVLQHVGDPVAVFRDMARLARPGGLIAARDADYPAMTWWPHEPMLDRWMELYLQLTALNGANADGGRQLFRWAQEAGLQDIAYSTSTWTFSSSTDLAWWSDLWADRVVKSRLGDDLLAHGLATAQELQDISAAWRLWATRPGAVFVVLHGEVLARPT
jgi:ubiquinone/menaquinone biosynthesis C-methylase UbiE